MIRPEISSAARDRSQRGQVIIMIVLMLALGAGFLVYSLAGSRALAAQKNADTDAALAQVKQALIGYAASPPSNATNTERPGELPCPDMNNDGFGDGSCVAGAIGRVPWKTLGIPEPQDGNGETLWYAIAGPFRNKNMSAAPINSDTLGNLSVYLGSSATVQTSQAAAVLFAPGPALGTQNRGTSTAACSTTGTSIARNLCAANYLESTGGGNNAQTGGPFIQAQSSATFNDRVLAITNADLMPLVEQRVAREMMVLLEAYYNAIGVYPWADISDGNSNGSLGEAYNRHRLPCGTALPTDWGSGGAPSLPDWLTNGCTYPVYGWTAVIYLAVAKSRLEGAGSICTSCTATNLNVMNSGWAYLCPHGSVPFACSLSNVPSGSARLILITPGASNGGASYWPISLPLDPITGYFNDAENSNDDDDNYVIPATSNDPNRDRMFIVR